MRLGPLLDALRTLAHEHLAQAKIGVFLASFVPGTVGLLILRITCPIQSKIKQDSPAPAH